MSHKTRIVIEFNPSKPREERFPRAESSVTIDGGRNPFIVFDAGSGFLTIKGTNIDITYGDVKSVKVWTTE